jgi:hypothetical protein
MEIIGYVSVIHLSTTRNNSANLSRRPAAQSQTGVAQWLCPAWEFALPPEELPPLLYDVGMLLHPLQQPRPTITAKTARYRVSRIVLLLIVQVTVAVTGIFSADLFILRLLFG